MAVGNIEAICANWKNTPVHTSLKANLKKIAADNNPWLNFYIGFSPAESIADTDCPVFALYGEKDITSSPGTEYASNATTRPESDRETLSRT